MQPFSTGAAYQTGNAVRTVTGGIYARYAERGGPAGDLGWVTGDQRYSSAAGGGWSQAFANGTLYFGAVQQNAVVLSGRMLSFYQGIGEASSALGWPRGPANRTLSGLTVRVQDFADGIRVPEREHGPHRHRRHPRRVRGGGRPCGHPRLGHRVRDEHDGERRRREPDVRSRHDVLLDTTHQARPLTGAYLSVYTAQGGVNGALGWPGPLQTVSAPLRHDGRVHERAHLQLVRRHVNEVKGGIRTAYLAHQGPPGRSAGRPR